MEELLKGLYYNTESPTAYTGVNKLFKAAKAKDQSITLRDVKDWLKKQYTYTLHKPIRKRYPRRQYFVDGVDKLWQIDLADVSRISDANNGTTFLLTCVDAFSKYAWVEPVKNKSGGEIVRAFNTILSSGRTPEKLQSDRGKEFLNTSFQKLLKQHNIHFYTCNNPDIKCSLVERFNRTLKSKLWKHFTSTRSYHYLDVLQSIVRGYNDSRHRSIGMTPVEGSLKDNERRVYMKLYGKQHGISTHDLAVGDLVRISKAKGLFAKGYLPNWSEELFKITKVSGNAAPTMYYLSDWGDEPIEGRFYPQELQVVTEPETYWIEKVIKTRRHRGKKEYFVKWLGYPEKFNSWITEDDGFLPLSTK